MKAWDNAGNASKVSFTLNFDQTAPTVQFAIPNEKSCEKVSVTDYGFFFNKDTDVVISASDPCNRKQNEATASGVKSITYKLVPFNQKFDEVEAITVDDSSVTVQALRARSMPTQRTMPATSPAHGKLENGAAVNILQTATRQMTRAMCTQTVRS